MFFPYKKKPANFKFVVHYLHDGGQNPVDFQMSILDFKVTEVKKNHGSFTDSVFLDISIIVKHSALSGVSTSCPMILLSQFAANWASRFVFCTV